MEEGCCVKERVILMYWEVESVLKSDEYLEDFCLEFDYFNLNYFIVFEKRIKDMEKFDYGIVVVGKWVMLKLI